MLSNYDFKSRNFGSRVVRFCCSVILPSNINSINSSILTYSIFFQTPNSLTFAYSTWLPSLCVTLLSLHYEHHLHTFFSHSQVLSHTGPCPSLELHSLWHFKFKLPSPYSQSCSASFFLQLHPSYRIFSLKRAPDLRPIFFPLSVHAGLNSTSIRLWHSNLPFLQHS